LIISDPLNFWRNSLRAATLLQRLLKDSDYQAHFTAAFNLLLPLISLNNHSGPWSMFSAVSVLTIQLIMNSLNIYYQFMLFRVSFPLVRFIRSPQPKHLKFLIFISWELPCCTSINFLIDVILKYVS